MQRDAMPSPSSAPPVAWAPPTPLAPAVPPTPFAAPSSSPPAPAAARPMRGGLVTLAYELRTAPVRQCFRRDFPSIGRWLNGLERARGFREVPASRCDDATGAITARMAGARTLFDEATRAFDAEVAAAGWADAPFHDPAAVTVAVPVASPLARLYLHVLSAADDAFASVERAWLLGVCDHRARRVHESSFRKALGAVTHEVRTQYGEMARWLRERKTVDAAGVAAIPVAAPTSSSVDAAAGVALSEAGTSPRTFGADAPPPAAGMGPSSPA